MFSAAMPGHADHMRRVIRKRIRRKTDHLNLAVDVNSDIAVNVGGSHHTARRRDRPTKQAGEAARPEADAGRRGHENANDEEAQQQ